MNSQRHSQAFQEQSLRKVFERGDRTISQVAGELGLKIWTLKGWMKKSRKRSRVLGGSKRGLAGPPPAERLALLLASAQLSGEALQGFCREHGIFSHQLEAWKAEFGQSKPAEADQPVRAERDALQQRCGQLERELQRKDKALAEAAALLVLSKKYQALLADEVE